MKMSKSEAGKLGAIASRVVSAKIRKDNEDKYLISPKKCTHCSTILSYDNRHKKFCNSSCSVTYNNLQRGRKVAHCIHCNLLLNDRLGKYCSIRCQQDFQSAKTIRKWKAGETITGLSVVRRYIKEEQNGKCAECGIADWNGKTITLELEHKDGNSDNNTPENLCLLCPNCHSQTPTYKAKNKGKGRHSRRERYKNGQSY